MFDNEEKNPEELINEIHALIMESGFCMNEIRARNLLERSRVNLPKKCNTLIKDIEDFLKC